MREFFRLKSDIMQGFFLADFYIMHGFLINGWSEGLKPSVLRGEHEPGFRFDDGPKRL